MAIRSASDKVHLHHAASAYGVILEYLACAYRSVLVFHHNGSCHFEPIPWADFGEKCRVVDASGAKIARLDIRRHVHRSFPREVEQAKAELSHCFQQKDSRIDRLTGKVSGENRIVLADESFAANSAMIEVDLRDPVHKQKWVSVWNQPLNLLSA
jgi:hypothetical protein